MKDSGKKQQAAPDAKAKAEADRKAREAARAAAQGEKAAR
jgi:hypothetical protein